MADPFVIARAKILSGCVVTEEKFKEGAAKIPNICKHFNIECIELKDFMVRQEWQF